MLGLVGLCLVRLCLFSSVVLDLAKMGYAGLGCFYIFACVLVWGF